MQSKSLLFLVGQFFDGLSSGMFMMALPWLMLSNGISGTFVAAVALACTIGSFILTPISATFIDRHSRKKILIIVQALQAAVALAVLVIFGLGSISLTVLVLAQLVFWWSGDVAWGANSAFVQEHFDSAEYSKISGRLEVVMQATSLGSGALGIALLSRWSVIEFSIFACIASLIAITCYLLMPYRRLVRANTSRQFLSQLMETKVIFSQKRAYFLFIALSCLSYPVLTFLAKLIPIYFSENNINGEWFAAWSVSYGIGALVCGLFVSHMLKKVAEEKAMIYSVLLISILLLFIYITPTPIMLILCTLPLGFLNSFNRISRVVKISIEIASEVRGRVDGGLKLFSTLSQSIGYVLIAWLSYNGITVIGFAVVGIVLLWAGVYMLVLYQQQKHQAKPILVV